MSAATRCPTIDGWPRERCETGTSADADEACDALDVRAQSAHGEAAADHEFIAAGAAVVAVLRSRTGAAAERFK